MIFCIFFNAAYLPQGIALYRSLERLRGENFTLYVLCMDEVTYQVLMSLNYASLRCIPLASIEDESLRRLRESRSVGEYCWTCTGPLLLYLLDRQPPGTVVTYVDADILFFSDPSAILDELGSGSIFIHEHDFAPRYSVLLAAAGRFNVGVVSFRNDAEGLKCLLRWREQCLDECVMDLESGRCGDQNYLDEWPTLYPNLVVSSNPGIGLGPWNIEKHSVGSKAGQVYVDCRPAVFYHYHSLRLLRPRLAIKPMLMSEQYTFENDVVRTFYHPYSRDLWRALEEIEQSGLSLSLTLDRMPDRYSEISGGQLLVSMGNMIAPRSWNSWILSVLSAVATSRPGKGDLSKFDGQWTAVSGFAEPEGPYADLCMPAPIRWTVKKKAILEIFSATQGKRRLVLSLSGAVPSQDVKVYAGDGPVERKALCGKIEKPESLSLEHEFNKGWNRLSINVDQLKKTKSRKLGVVLRSVSFE